MKTCGKQWKPKGTSSGYQKQDLFGSPSHKSDKSNPTDFRFALTDVISGRSSKPLPPIFDIQEPSYAETGLVGRKVRTPTEKLSTFKCNSGPSTKELPESKYFRSMKSHPNPDTPQSLKYLSRQEPNREYYGSPHNDTFSSISMEFRNSNQSELNNQLHSPVQFTDRMPRPSDNRGGDYQRPSYRELFGGPIPETVPSEIRLRRNEDMFKKSTSNLKETTSTLSTVRLAHRRSGQTLPKAELRRLPFQSPPHSGSKLKIEDFEKIKSMGKGKFGSVFMVRHRQTGFLAALKVIKKRQIVQQKLVTQLLRELKIHAYLSHPNIIDFYGFFEDKQHVYILLELGSQGQLYTKLKQKETYSQEATAFIIKNLLEAVQYMHNKKLLHRDIKPQNIVVVHGTVKLCDFGWAVFRGNDLRSTFCGTPLYVSPEILLGQPYGEHTDLWAIGILTYQLMMGTIPFSISREQELQKIVTDEIRFPSYIDLSEEYKDFVLKILRKNPKDRMCCEDLLLHPFLEKYSGFETCQQLCGSD